MIWQSCELNCQNTYLSDQFVIIYLAVCSSTDVPGRHHLVCKMAEWQRTRSKHTVSTHTSAPVRLSGCLLNLRHRYSAVLQVPARGTYRMTCLRKRKRLQQCADCATLSNTTRRNVFIYNQTQKLCVRFAVADFGCSEQSGGDALKPQQHSIYPGKVDKTQHITWLHVYKWFALSEPIHQYTNTALKAKLQKPQGMQPVLLLVATCLASCYKFCHWKH